MFNFNENFNRLKNGMCLDGMTDDFFALFISEIFKKKSENIVVVTSTLYEANKLFRVLNSHTEDCHLFPMDDFLTSESIAISPELKITRLETINQLLNKKAILITHLNGYLRFLPEKKIYIDKILNLKVGKQVERDALIRKLYSLGYHKEVIVSQTGEFGIRGYILDIFCLGEEYPMYNNLHQYSKNKIHCSCPDCRGRSTGHGNNSIEQYKLSDQKKLNEMESRLNEIRD